MNKSADYHGSHSLAASTFTAVEPWAPVGVGLVGSGGTHASKRAGNLDGGGGLDDLLASFFIVFFFTESRNALDSQPQNSNVL